MALRREIVDFVRLDLLNDANQIRRVGQIDVMQIEMDLPVMRVLIQVVDPIDVAMMTRVA